MKGLRIHAHDGRSGKTDLVAVGAVFENADKGDVVILQESGATVRGPLVGTPRSPCPASQGRH